MQDPFDLAEATAIIKKKSNKHPSNPDPESRGHFPKWLHRTIPKGDGAKKTDHLVEKYKLNTVCEEAKCPNRMECYSSKTATFLILGDQCTRACGFCDIDFSKQPKAPEADEPMRVANFAKEMGLSHVVITMVARDDLPDQGASHLCKVIDAVREVNPASSIEVLTSDFSGQKDALDRVLSKAPEVFNHNVETIRRLTPRVRHTATYERSLDLLKYVKDSGRSMYVKSGLMLGLGESFDEVKECLEDLKDVGCDIVTVGQYLQASPKKLRVSEYITPDIFNKCQEYGESIGIRSVYAGSFVRSSYNAKAVTEALRTKRT